MLYNHDSYKEINLNLKACLSNQEGKIRRTLSPLLILLVNPRSNSETNLMVTTIQEIVVVEPSQVETTIIISIVTNQYQSLLELQSNVVLIMNGCELEAFSA